MKEEEAEAEMAAALQAQIRSLEQAELSQMRQGAQLQLRLEAAQRQLQELAEGEEAQRQARVEHLQAEEVQAVRSLQGELQLQCDACLMWPMLSRGPCWKHSCAEKRRQRRCSARRQHAPSGWMRRVWAGNCGLVLRRKQAGEMLKRSRNDACEEELFNYVEQAKRQHAVLQCSDLEVPRESEAGPQVAMEIEALRAQAKELRIQIKEMERLAASGRAQEVDLIAKNQSMAHSISMAEAAAKASREKVEARRVMKQVKADASVTGSERLSEEDLLPELAFSVAVPVEDRVELAPSVGPGPSAEDEAVDVSMSSEEPMELRLSGKDISNRCNLATQERQENTEYLLLTEVLKQAKVTPLNQAWPNVIPETVVIQAGIIIAFAAKLWLVRDLGSYNLAVMDASARGYKLCILDMADWVPWGQRCPVFPGKQKARGLLTFVRHGHSEGLLRLFESFAGQNPAQENRKAGSSVSEGNLTGGAGNLKCLRLKTNVQQLSAAEAQELFDGVEARSYDRVDGAAKQTGFVAQEVYESGALGKSFCKLKTFEDRELMTLDYQRMTAVLWQTCKGLQRRIEKLEKKKRGEECGDSRMCRNNRSMIEMVFLQNSMIREFFQNSNMIEMVFLQNGMIREFFTEFFMNSSMIDMVFVQNGMIREFLNNRNMGMIVLMIFGMSAEPLNNHNMGMVVFLNSNSVVN
ncbi:hypothetical protein AK812_SmicGene3122 [Symbiodinium microadriaticum]|uniref:Peptidase S74 domain-containing protein n=1 Tax=Symbiodinium microadriaticum TaxID=2951 RepID=A0A1Q9EZQ9_SYMMI|nr:hypothetical protein AK812_SmicGene3122 [Symbiodinium microadriaticum]